MVSRSFLDSASGPEPSAQIKPEAGVFMEDKLEDAMRFN